MRQIAPQSIHISKNLGGGGACPQTSLGKAASRQKGFTHQKNYPQRFSGSAPASEEKPLARVPLQVQHSPLSTTAGSLLLRKLNDTIERGLNCGAAATPVASSTLERGLLPTCGGGLQAGALDCYFEVSHYLSRYLIFIKNVIDKQTSKDLSGEDLSD